MDEHILAGAAIRRDETITMAIPAAIRPYSMAVAPDSSDKNLTK
jgi:hypothetical protein